MPIKNATAQGIERLKQKLSQRQADRKAEQQMDEVVRMVQRRPFVALPAPEVEVTVVADDTAFLRAMAHAMLACTGALWWNVTGKPAGLILFWVCAFTAYIYLRGSGK